MFKLEKFQSYSQYKLFVSLCNYNTYRFKHFIKVIKANIHKFNGMNEFFYNNAYLVHVVKPIKSIPQPVKTL